MLRPYGAGRWGRAFVIVHPHFFRMTADLHAFLRSRRTIHAFRPEPPPVEALHRAIAVACTAPNHRLTEPWRFTIIGPETAREIALLNARLIGAEAARKKRARWLAMPGWFAVTCRRSDDPLRMREDRAATACAVGNLLLALWAEGLGTKWGTGGVTRDPAFYDLLGIDPGEEETVGLFWYGTPEIVPPMPPRRAPAEVTRVLP